MEAPRLPLAVDLDHTLVRGDRLHETMVEVLFREPWLLPAFFLAWARSRPAMKRFLALRATAFDAATLPYRQEVLEAAEAARAQGREVVLVTGSDEILARKVADETEAFDGVFGSDGKTNLSGEAKARFLVARYGEKGFEYWGDHPKDRAVWASAARVGLVGPQGAERRLGLPRVDERFVTDDPPAWRELLRALRPEQWAKNLLLLLPLLFGQRYGDAEAWGGAGLAFLAMSVAASGVYLLNDLMDLGSDRAHPTKSARPLARGTLGIPLAFAAAAALLGSALFFPFGVPIGIYVLLALLYSTALKRVAGLDVLALAALYTLRVFLGAEAVGVAVSQWLFTFSLFFFLSLALLKRFSELGIVENPGRRAYRAGDRTLLAMFGASTAVGSVLVLALYLQHPAVTALYSRPGRLWFALPLALYGILRMWMRAARGETGDDPVATALRDPVSYALIAAGALVVLWAT